MSNERILARYSQYSIDKDIDIKARRAISTADKNKLFRAYKDAAWRYVFIDNIKYWDKQYDLRDLYEELVYIARKKIYWNPLPRFLFVSVEHWMEKARSDE